MTTYFIRRILLIIPTFLGVTLIGFFITRMVPGGPVERAMMQQQMGGGEAGGSSGGIKLRSGKQVDEDTIKHLKKEFNLDKPWYQSYFVWLNRLIRGDLGQSYNTRLPVSTLIAERLPISLTFGLTGFLLAYLISIPLGILKAIKHGSLFDFSSSAIVFLGYSIPGWALGALLLTFLASGRFYDVFPLGNIKTTTYQQLPDMVKNAEPFEKVSDQYGQFVWEKMSVSSKLIDTIYHMFLPVFCYTIGGFATLTILMKNSLMDNLGKDYVRTAYAKGLSPFRVIFIHVLRNSLIPIATGLGSAITLVMAGSYLIEYIFGINGIGLLGYNSIVGVDYTVVMGILAINTLLTLLGNIFSDILYAVIDPRIRFE